MCKIYSFNLFNYSYRGKVLCITFSVMTTCQCLYQEDMDQRKYPFPDIHWLLLDVLIAFVLDLAFSLIEIYAFGCSSCPATAWTNAVFDTLCLVLHICVICCTKDFSCMFLRPRSFSVWSFLGLLSCLFLGKPSECLKSNTGIIIYNGVFILLSFIPECIECCIQKKDYKEERCCCC